VTKITTNGSKNN